MSKRDLRPALIAVALLLAAAPTAQAVPLWGTVEAERLMVEGPVEVSGQGLAVRMGGGAGELLSEPRVALEGAKVTIHYNFAHTVGSPLLVAAPSPVDPTQNGSKVLHDARVRFESWDLTQGTLIGLALPTGRVEALMEGTFPEGTYLETVGSNGRQVSLTAADDSSVVSGSDVRLIQGDALWLNATAMGGAFRYKGDFEVLLYGTTFVVQGSDGEFRAATGLTFRNAGPGLREDWRNVTRLEVEGGSLVFAAGDNPTDAFGQRTMRLVGDGLLRFESPAGTLRDADDRDYPAGAGALELVGAYDATLRYESSVGYSAGLAGDFDGDALGISGAMVALGGGALWPFLLIGVAVVASGGGVLAFRRRNEKPHSTVTTAQVEIVTSPPLAEPAIRDPLEEPELESPMPPGTNWAQIAEEFGVIQAADAAGIVVVLVSITRMKTFIQSVVQRGLIAEDTGDRVHVGETEMAVVTLEPSPVMMN